MTKPIPQIMQYQEERERESDKEKQNKKTIGTGTEKASFSKALLFICT